MTKRTQKTTTYQLPPPKKQPDYKPTYRAVKVQGENDVYQCLAFDDQRLATGEQLRRWADNIDAELVLHGNSGGE